MFALWYTTISWKEYRDVILESITKKKNSNKNISNKPECQKPVDNVSTKPELPKILNTDHQKKTVVIPDQPTIPKVVPPIQISESPTLPLKKPVRLPSPHPIQTLEYDEEEDSDVEELDDDDDEEEEEDEEDDEEDEEDSIVDLVPNKLKPILIEDKKMVNIKNSVNDFLTQEIGNQKSNIDFKQRKSQTMVDQAVIEKLEAGFKKLDASDSKSLLKKFLTREVLDNLKTKKTGFGSTLLDVVQSGFENHDSGIGLYAPDAESYTTFADLFDPVIEDYHTGFKKTDKHPPKNWGDVSVFGNLDPTGEYIVSTRVRCGRSMEGYPFNPCLTEEQYKEMEQKVATTLSGLEGELKGTFFPLTGMTKDVQQKLIDDHFLFKEGDRFLQAANACRFWPSGRGIYHNEKKTFLVWCNEEDHLRIISMQMGGDLGEVYRRLVTAVNDIEKRIPFSHNDRLGFLTFCPTNLGTTVRASVHIKVPKLSANKAKLEEVASKYSLQVRGTRGEHTEAEGGVYDISNKRRMGLTEFDAVKEMYDGIAEIIKIEKEL